jgi:hypothetical protein
MEREESLRRRQWFRGLNTPGPAPGPTLSGWVRLCPVRTPCPGRSTELRFLEKFEDFKDCIETKDIYIDISHGLQIIIT